MALEQATGFETALRAYVQNCLDTTDNCFLGDTVDEGLATITGLLDSIEEEPLPAGDRELTVGNAFYGVITPLYNRDYWFLLSTALASALEGKGSALMSLADAYASRNPDGSYADNSVEANYSINCLDDPTSVPFGEVPSLFPEFEEASPTFGRIFAWGMALCRGIDVSSSEEPLTIRGEGAAPIVVLGTSRDPATPLKWAEALSAQLDSGRARRARRRRPHGLQRRQRVHRHPRRGLPPRRRRARRRHDLLTPSLGCVIPIGTHGCGFGMTQWGPPADRWSGKPLRDLLDQRWWSALERGVERDVDGGERLADRAVGLGLLGGLLERRPRRGPRPRRAP